VKRLPAAIISALVVTIMAVAPAVAHIKPHAGAHAAPWRWKTVDGGTQQVPGGTQADVKLNCPTGYRPVSLEWRLETSSLVRQAEYMDYSGNWGRAFVYNPTTTTRTVKASLDCVNAADVGTISVTSKDFAATGGQIGGFVACPVLTTTMIGGGADFGSYEDGRSIDYSAPTSSGWYVSAHGATGSLHVEAYCISLGYQAGMHLVQQRVGATSATASCSSTERVVSGGGLTYSVGGSIDPKISDGKLTGVSQLHGAPGSLTSYASVNTTSTWFVAEALCAPVSVPNVLFYTAPSGDQFRSNISYTFTASDPAGEDLTYQCYLNGNYGYPCVPGTTPNTVSNLDDGTYALRVDARNDSNVVGATTASFRIDTTPPTVNLGGKPSDPTDSRTANFTLEVSDNITGVGQVLCRLDTASEDLCPTSPSYANLADGSHTFAWRASDGVGNQDSGSYTWVVDATPPTATLTAPGAPFTQTTSARVKWTGDDAGTGVASWDIQWQRATYKSTFGAWSTPDTFAANASSNGYTGLARGSDTCYRVRGTDSAGNTSAWSKSRCTAVLLDDRAFTASAGWSRIAGGGYYAGTASSTTRINATLTLVGAQLDRLAVLATTCPTCGLVGVYVKDALVGAVDLHAASTHERQLLTLPAFGYRTGTVTLKVLTSGKLVRIDGVGTSRT
jgi:hypothetical protein